jgi:hypothetical protein
MCDQFTNNGHMAGFCPTMSGLKQDRHNSALQLFLAVMERHYGGRWDTITADFGNKPIKSSASPTPIYIPLAVTPLTPLTCSPV